MKLILALPFPIILAIMFNEIKDSKLGKIRGLFKEYYIYLIFIVGRCDRYIQLLAPDDGLMNQLIHKFGGDGSTYFMMNPEYFHTIMFSSYIWKNVGWDSIIYFAAIMSINPEIYESAAIDGANRFKQIIHITLPMLTPTIVILFIISLGDILKAGFDQIYLLKTPGNECIRNIRHLCNTHGNRTGRLQLRHSYRTFTRCYWSNRGRHYQ